MKNDTLIFAKEGGLFDANRPSAGVYFMRFWLVLLLLLPFSMAALSDGLIAYWSLDIDCRDDWTGTYNGTPTAGMTKNETWYWGDSTSDYCTLANSFVLQENWTVSVWFKPRYCTGYTGFIGSSTSWAGYIRQQSSCNTWQRIIVEGDTGNVEETLDSKIYLQPNWAHYIIRSEDRNKTVLTNGIQVNMDWATSPANLTVGYIASGYSLTTRSLNGSIDEIVVWNRTLTDAEAAEVYHWGRNYLIYAPDFYEEATVNITNCSDCLNLSVSAFCNSSFNENSTFFFLQSYYCNGGEHRMIFAIIPLIPLVFGLFLIIGAYNLSERHALLRIVGYLMSIPMIWGSLHLASLVVIKYYDFPELTDQIAQYTRITSWVFFALMSYFIIYLFYVMIKSIRRARIDQDDDEAAG